MQHAQDSFKYRGTHKGTVKYALRACGRWAKEWFVEKLLAGTKTFISISITVYVKSSEILYIHFNKSAYEVYDIHIKSSNIALK
jgi:LEA14-like dessication related protein